MRSPIASLKQLVRRSEASALSPTQTPSLRIQGRWLLLAWIVWGALAVLALALHIVALTSLYSMLSAPPTPVSAWLADLGLPLRVYATYLTGLALLFAAGCVVVGVLIAWRKPDDAMALFVSLMLVLLGTCSDPGATALVERHPELFALVSFLYALLNAGLLLFFFLFPNGRFVPRWAKLPVMAASVWFLVLSFAGWHSDALFFLSVTTLVAGILAQVYRYLRVSSRLERQQTKWLVLSVAAGFLGFALVFLLQIIAPGLQPQGFQASPYDLVGTSIISVTFFCIPLSIGIALLRYRLWDVDILINRTLVYGGLSACVIGVYVLVVGYFSLLFQARGSLLIGMLASGLVAVLFQPLRGRLQRAVNRLMYGERDDPYAVLSRLARNLEVSIAPESVLPTIVRAVKEALKLPYAAIALKQDEDLAISAADGVAVGTPLILPLVYQSEMVGELRLAPRASGETFSPADRRLLDDLARQAGVAAHAVRLTNDLQRSRQRLVTAREEERRRLRRDLHDGLGPTLASLSMKLDVAQTLVVDQPPVGVALLAEIQTELKATLGNVRRVVYGLRPPVLDQFGLPGAIREYVLVTAQTGGVHVELDDVPALPALPAAIEVAAYYIALAAIDNVLRHARARHCRIRLRAGAALELEIEDDGRGLPASLRYGVGIHSMRERAEELGGRLAIERLNPSGTRIYACLPLAKE